MKRLYRNRPHLSVWQHCKARFEAVRSNVWLFYLRILNYYSVIYDSGSVPDYSIFSPRGTSLEQHCALRCSAVGSRRAPAKTPGLGHLRPTVANTVQGYLAHKKVTPLGPYSRPMRRAIWWSNGGVRSNVWLCCCVLN